MATTWSVRHTLSRPLTLTSSLPILTGRFSLWCNSEGAKWSLVNYHGDTPGNTGLRSVNNERMLLWWDITIYTETKQSLLMVLCSPLCFQSDVTIRWRSGNPWQESFVSWQSWLALLSVLSCPSPSQPGLISTQHLELNSAQQIFSQIPGVKRLSDIIKFAQVCNKLRGDFAKIEMKTHSFIIVLKWALYRV